MIEEYLQLEINKDGVAYILLNNINSKQNIISLKLIDYFDNIVDRIINDKIIKAAIFYSLKKDFIAGADIQSFNAKKLGDFKINSIKGHRILNKIENSNKPFIAAINGSAYGLGVELSLACHSRIITNDINSKLALPEVKLGLLPGSGGTQRLPKLIGLKNSLEMMLTGKNIFYDKAKKMGLVDLVVEKEKLKSVSNQVALAILKNNFKKNKPKKNIFHKIIDHTKIGREIMFYFALKKIKAETRNNYPAPIEILNCIKKGYQNSDEGYKMEVDKFEELMIGDVSSELRNLFFISSKKKKNPFGDKYKNKTISNIGIIGSGFMGTGIAEISSINNNFVLLKDISEKKLQNSKKIIWRNLLKKVYKKIITYHDAKSKISKIKTQTSYDNFKYLDLVIESAFEEVKIKQKIFSEIEKNSNDKTIFATNTSALSINEISKFIKNNTKIVGLHYFSPVNKMPLIEIVKLKNTPDEVISKCIDFSISQNKTFIVVKDGPGFYVNRILAPYLNEAMIMLEEGESIRKIDESMVNFGFPIGPFTLMDEVGIDVCAKVMSGNLVEMFRKRSGFYMSNGLLEMYKNGYLGKKNKKGFLLYKKNGKKIKGKINNSSLKFFNIKKQTNINSNIIQERLVSLIINESVKCLEEGIIQNPSDGDIGAIFGMGFRPFSGGPFRMINKIGIDNFIKTLENNRRQFGERYNPTNLLYQYKDKSKSFY